MSHAETDDPAGVVGRVDMDAATRSPSDSFVTLLLIGGAALLIMLAALLIILSNVFKIA
jgi:hypothetical protein